MTSYRQLYIAAKKRHRELEAEKIGKVEVSASGIEFVRPLGGGIDHPGVPNRVDRWREENPGVVTRWETQDGGYVTQMWDARIYRGECVDCGDLVTRTRYVGGMRHHAGKIWIGTWPKYCGGCSAAREDKHNDGARARMAKLRAERRKMRDDECRSFGYEPPRQGVRAKKVRSTAVETPRPILHRRQPVLCAKCLQPMDYLVATRRRVRAATT
jgi:hypothetical protein